MGLTKRFLDETKSLTPGEQAIADEIERQAQGNYDEAIRYAAKSLRIARNEEDRLTEIIKRKRLRFSGSRSQDSIRTICLTARRPYQRASTRRRVIWSR